MGDRLQRIARFKADKPGSLLWWVQYISGYHLRLCWTGHLHKADDECREFWRAERELV